MGTSPHPGSRPVNVFALPQLWDTSLLFIGAPKSCNHCPLEAMVRLSELKQPRVYQEGQQIEAATVMLRIRRRTVGSLSPALKQQMSALGVGLQMDAPEKISVRAC